MIGVRVMTWNLWWRFGEPERRRAAILAVLREQRPDLVGLQEVWADDDTNLAGWLADELGLHWAFGAGSDQESWRVRVDGAPGLRNGVAVLSRWPIQSDKAYDLPGDPSRAALSVLVDAPHATIPFVTTHLSVLSGSAGRSAQLDWLARHVRSLPHDGHPPVVVGDFNAMPESDELRRFGGELTVGYVPDQRMLDAWWFADHGDPGWTWDRANPHAAAFVAPSSRIDYIHVLLSIHRAGRVLGVHRAASTPVDGIWPSDHAAVVADLSE
ncbi:endonuclease/exonuclease/phosphatase family protein [Asanoa sp. NPDC050611]|uniref:endonuclease/exonuclease/phosphatase family protein n=1 Tax=Asanoa sp. NPDC050611 TaxID=3157098 RepID=UPI0033CFCBEE